MKPKSKSSYLLIYNAFWTGCEVSSARSPNPKIVTHTKWRPSAALGLAAAAPPWQKLKTIRETKPH